MGEQKKRWYVVKAIAGKENKAKEYIDKEIARLGLNNLVSNVLIPTEKVYSVRNGKRVSKERTLFPGYIFVEATLEGEVIGVIRNIPNVLDFISEKGGKPVPMQDFEVKRILGQVDQMMDNNEELSEPFIIGETVKIIDGPFKNFSGVIEELNLEKKKLKVIVKIFGRKTPVELSFIQVEK
jgi:transcription termination/antitermination protein NusG